MHAVQRILCPIDFSACSRRALDQAAALARRHEASLTVLHVFAAACDEADDCSPMAERLAETIRSVAAPICREVAVRIEAICDVDAAAAILRRATALDTDLIVMGTHGRSGLKRILLGSIVDRVLRRADCCVLAVPAHTAGTPVAFSRTLVVGRSSHGHSPLHDAMALTSRDGALIYMVRVLDPAAVSYRSRARAIVADAEEQDCDLIVLGTDESASDISRGDSVTECVLRNCACPVLAMPAPTGDRRGRHPILAVAVTALALMCAACAHVRPTQSWPEVTRQLASGRLVAVTDTTGAEVRGKVSRIDADSLTLNAGGRLRRFEAADVRRIARDGDSLWNGFAIGAGIGVLAAAMGDNRCTGRPPVCTDRQIPGRIALFGIATATGIGFDALHRDRRLIYRAPDAAAGFPPPVRATGPPSRLFAPDYRWYPACLTASHGSQITCGGDCRWLCDLRGPLCAGASGSRAGLRLGGRLQDLP